jgi:hypothetical protein
MRSVSMRASHSVSSWDSRAVHACSALLGRPVFQDASSVSVAHSVVQAKLWAPPALPVASTALPVCPVPATVSASLIPEVLLPVADKVASRQEVEDANLMVAAVAAAVAGNMAADTQAETPDNTRPTNTGSRNMAHRRSKPYARSSSSSSRNSPTHSLSY